MINFDQQNIFYLNSSIQIKNVIQYRRMSWHLICGVMDHINSKLTWSSSNLFLRTEYFYCSLVSRPRFSPCSNDNKDWHHFKSLNMTLIILNFKPVSQMKNISHHRTTNLCNKVRFSSFLAF